MIKDIGVHLTGSTEDEVRIAHAAMLARTFDAHLTGLHVHQLPDVLSITDPSGSSFLQELLKQSIDKALLAGEELRARLAETGIGYELRRLDAYEGEAGRQLASEARQSDLFVGTRPYGDPNRQQWIEEAVLFESGRPCLFVPPGYGRHAAYANVLIAWKDTREAARAVADAMPFLDKARSVVVAIVNDGPVATEEQADAPDEDVGRLLSRHGIKAEVHVIDGWTNVGAALLNEVVRTAADLVVMGAYGHSRYREWLIGGATRDVLSSAAVPVLVAH